MKIIVNGALGKMGKELIRLAQNQNIQSIPVDRLSNTDEVFKSLSLVTEGADVIVDFSHHSATAELCAYAAERKIPLVIATTGQTPEERKIISETANITAVFFTGNMSLGIALLANLVRQTVKMFPDADVEIVEAHHNQKVDAPSGTALMLASAVQAQRPDAKLVYGRSGNCKRDKNEIGMHSLRMGSVIGQHEVIIATDTQTLTLKHEAHSRLLFADGAIEAAKYMCGKPAGNYDMYSLISNSSAAAD